MFDFNRLGMRPGSTTGYKPAATEAQIAELEQHCAHPLPENYKTILRDYNGGLPTTRYFDVVEPETGIPLEWPIAEFYFLTADKASPANVWWRIDQYGSYMGENTLPFADDGVDQFYFMKWVNDVPQVWFLEYLDLEEPITYFVMDSFDSLLDAMYAY